MHPHSFLNLLNHLHPRHPRPAPPRRRHRGRRAGGAPAHVLIALGCKVVLSRACRCHPVGGLAWVVCAAPLSCACFLLHRQWRVASSVASPPNPHPPPWAALPLSPRAPPPAGHHDGRGGAGQRRRHAEDHAAGRRLRHRCAGAPPRMVGGAPGPHRPRAAWDLLLLGVEPVEVLPLPCFGLCFNQSALSSLEHTSRAREGLSLHQDPNRPPSHLPPLPGPAGASVREIMRRTGADIKSWTEAHSTKSRRPARIFLIGVRRAGAPRLWGRAGLPAAAAARATLMHASQRLAATRLFTASTLAPAAACPAAAVCYCCMQHTSSPNTSAAAATSAPRANLRLLLRTRPSQPSAGRAPQHGSGHLRDHRRRGPLQGAVRGQVLG
jgi:hypothetical protein